MSLGFGLKCDVKFTCVVCVWPIGEDIASVYPIGFSTKGYHSRWFDQVIDLDKYNGIDGGSKYEDPLYQKSS